MPLTVINGPTIAAGEALSDVVDVSAGALVRLTMPVDWTAADLTFQISSDGEFFNDLYDHNGGEVTCVCTPGVGIIFPGDFMLGVAFLRFRSGTSQNPQPQPEERAFSVAVLSDDGPVLPSGAKAGKRTRTAHRKTPRKTAKPRRARSRSKGR